MAQPGEYVDMSEFKDMAIKLAMKYPDKYGNIPLDKIKFYAVVNKERPNARSKVFNFSFMPEPIAQEILIDAVCVIFLSSWASLADKNKVLIVSSALSSLEFDGNQIKSKGFDMRDHKDMVELFGVDYENSPDVPDILGLENI